MSETTPALAPRDLLACALARRADLLSSADLDATIATWRTNPQHPLAHHLPAHCAAAVEAMLEAFLARHGDPAACLRRLDLRYHIAHLVGESIAPPTNPPGIDTPPPPGAAAPNHDQGPRYRHVRYHAGGGLGEVFLARDAELNRHVALKEIRAEHADNPDSRSRFIFEAQITAALDHPGIVPVFGRGEYPDGRPFYAMRFINRGTLEEAIDAFHRGQRPKASTELTLRGLLRRFVDACNAVAYAHSRGVIHRDIKPPNIMLGKFGETLVVDWGVAKLMPEGTEGVRPIGQDTIGVAHSSAGLDTLSAPGTNCEDGHIIGTPAYLSPEQARGQVGETGPRSDIYCLGTTLYHLLTGLVPFAGRDRLEILRKVIAGDCPPAHEATPRVPVPLSAICARAMALAPENRYASATDLAADIERWLADEPIAVYREPLHVRLGRTVRRNPAKASSLLVLLLAGMIGLACGLYAVRQEEKRTAKARDDEATAKQAALEAERKATDNLRLAEENLTMVHALLDDSLELGNVHIEQHPSRALVHYEKARALYSALARRYPNETRYQANLAVVWFNLGVLQNQAGQPGASISSFSKAIVLLKQIKAAPPHAPLISQPLVANLSRVAELRRKAHGARALARRSIGDHARSAEDWAEVVALAESGQRLGYRVLRAEALARAGDHREAMREARDLAEEDLAPSTTYRLAVACALCVPSDETGNRVSLALVLFEKVRRANYFNRERLAGLRRDPDLDALRQSKDFRDWLARAEADE